MKTSEKTYLLTLFNIAVNESLPDVCMPRHLTKIDASNGICVIGAGKAAVQMAEVINQHFPNKCFGSIVTRYGYTEKTTIGKINILTASHPIPDEGSLAAGVEMLQLARNNPANIPVVFLISGGGSALLSLPIEGLEFSEKIKINRFLLASGASIDEINIVRKQLSQIKGNKLAEAVKGPYQTLIISDVVGDDPSLIASGPTVSDSSTAQQALAVLRKYKWEDLNTIKSILDKSPSQILKSIKHHDVIMMANAELSINKAMEAARIDGWDTKVLSYDQEGEASTIAKRHADLALSALRNNQSIILFSGGELTVTLSENSGLGGPNQEYLLALAIELNGVEGVSAIACDTDGIDGSMDVAGAFIDHTTLIRASEKLMNPKLYLNKNESYVFFNQLGDLIQTGPTHTNVNDFRAIMVKPPSTS